MRKEKKHTKYAIKTIIGLLFILASGFLISQNIVINRTDSVETGIYRKVIFSNFSKGHYVIYKPNDKYKKYVQSTYGNTQNGKLMLLKKIVGTEGDVIEEKNFKIYINGEEKGKIYRLKGLTETSPNYKKVLSKDEVFLMGETPDSFDGRYFGVIKKKELVSEVKLVISGNTIENVLGKITPQKLLKGTIVK